MADKGAGGGRDGWADRVEFSDGDGVAYMPGEVLVPVGSAAEAEELINRRQAGRTSGRTELEGSTFELIPNVDDALGAVQELRHRGIPAQPNHVLFSHCLCCGCGPHPAMLWPSPYAQMSAYPFAANPFAANPYADADVQASPVRLLADGGTRPETAAFRATGLRPHSAHAARVPNLPDAPALPAEHQPTPSILIIDTGLAASNFRPAALGGVLEYETPGFPPAEEPDENRDDRIDPVAGHGTFIAGVIDRIVPGSKLEVHGLLTGEGEANEVAIAATLDSLVDRPQGPPDLLNLSFGGYTAVEMGRLAEAVRRLQGAGTVIVASAGNDATCWPSYPAAFPGVVAVGALGPNGPAPFTNYGPWVRACAPGVDVVSTFFTGLAPELTDRDLDEWVRWSGTSFAAPAVVGALARAMRDGLDDPRQAVERVIDDDGLFRIPGLGAVVNQTPWCRRA